MSLRLTFGFFFKEQFLSTLCTILPLPPLPSTEKSFGNLLIFCSVHLIESQIIGMNSILIIVIAATAATKDNSYP